LAEGIEKVRRGGGEVHRQEADSSDLARLLRLGGERTRKKRPGRDQEVPALESVQARSSP
jgi:hypothetical protein